MNTVYDSTADQRQKNHRQGEAQSEYTEPERRIGQLQNEPSLGHILHPGPDVRNDQTGPEQHEIAMLQGRITRNFGC